MTYYCGNSECGWTGERDDCVYPKHSDPDDDANLRCPECYEVVEPEQPVQAEMFGEAGENA